MSDSERQLVVNASLHGRQIEEFEQIKNHLGIDSDAGVVHYLIRQEARRISGGSGAGSVDQILDAYLSGHVTAEEAMSVIASRERPWLLRQT